MGEVVCLNGEAEHQRLWLSHRIASLRRYRKKILGRLAGKKDKMRPADIRFVHELVAALGEAIEAAEEFYQRVLASGTAIPEEELEREGPSNFLASFQMHWLTLKSANPL